MTLPVVRSLLTQTDNIEREPDTGESRAAVGSTIQSILPIMMMMGQRKHGYHGLGYMGGVYGMGPGSGGGAYGGLGMSSPYANAMAFPLQQAHMLQSNPFLDPSKNPFMA